MSAGKFNDSKIAQLRVMAGAGLTLKEIAAALGVSIPGALKAARRCGIVTRKRGDHMRDCSRAKISASKRAYFSIPENRAAQSARRIAHCASAESRAVLSAAQRLSWASGRRPRKYRPSARRGDVAIPNWVGDLAEDYYDWAIVFGEEAAATHVRRLKRDALAKTSHFTIPRSRSATRPLREQDPI